MDKYEYRVRAEEINALIDKKEYAEAVKIADTIDWRRVKSVMMLCRVSDLYKMNRRYEDSKEVLLLAYDRHPGGRKIIYSLCELCIKLEEIVQAVEYYKEFVQVAPRDTGRFVLQYRLYEAQDVSLEERIAVLEEYKKRDYREKWAYELAYLYHRIGLATRCVEECDELILWFGEGRYVIKAMELKMLHEPLTPAQQEKYDRRLARRAAKKAETEEILQNGQTANIDIEGETGTAAMTLPISIKAVEASNAPTAKIPSRRVQEGLDEPDEAANTDEQMMSEDEMDEAEEIAKTQSISQEELEEKLAGPQDDLDKADESGAERIPEEESPDVTREADDDLDIQIKTIDVGEYNTINLQQELAKNLAKMLAEEDMEAADATKALPIDTILESTDPHLIRNVTDDTIKNAIVAPLLQDTAELTPITEEDLLASLDEKPKTVEEIDREEEQMSSPAQETVDDGETAVFEEEPSADTDIGVTGVTSAIQATVQNMDEVLHTSEAEEPEMPKEPEVPKEQHLNREELMRVISQRAAKGRSETSGRQEEQFPQTAGMQGAAEEERQQPVLLGQETKEEPQEAELPVTKPQPIVEQQAVEPMVTEPQPIVEQRAAEPTVTEPQSMAEQQEAEPPVMEPQPVAEQQQAEPPVAEPQPMSGQQAQAAADQLEQQMINEQISGQLSFTDIMAEWEETKKASEEKHREEMRQRMIKQTGPMFADFDAVARASVSSDFNLISPMEDVFQATTDMATEAETALKADLPAEEKVSAGTEMFNQAQATLQQKGQSEENQEPEEEPVKTKIFNTAEIRDIEKQLLNNLQKENNRVEPELVTPVIPETGSIPVVSAFRQETEEQTTTANGQEISGQGAEYTLNNGTSQTPETAKPAPRRNAIVETGDIEFTDLTQDEEKETQAPVGNRSLTKQERELFGNFAQTETVERQITSTIDNISLSPATGNVLITGTAGTGTLTVAKNLIKIVQASNARFSHKVAKITGSILNKKDIGATLGSLVNGALIVERAGELTPQVCENIVNYLKGLSEDQGFLMLLEDTKGNIDKLMGVYPQMPEVFNNRIDVAALDNDALVSYGKEYAKVQDYAIDDMGTLALYTRIADMQTRDHHVTVEEVKSIVDEAIMNASKKSVSHLVDVIFAKRYDSEDMIVLREKDFLKDR